MKTLVASIVVVLSLSSVILIGSPINSNVVKPLNHGVGHT
ncbi:hypothetical protein J2T13_004075 [Paenibacillus sp. DS2015]